MPAGPQTLKLSIVNKSPFVLGTTERDRDTPADAREFNFAVTSGQLDPATPPAMIDKDGTGALSIATTDGTKGPEGWICYELVGCGTVARITFNDPAVTAGADAVSVIENAYDHAVGVLAATVVLTDQSGAALAQNNVASATQINATITIDATSAIGQTGNAQPGVGTLPAAGAPGAGVGLSAPGLVAKWNDPKLSAKRKKILAAIGNLFPLQYFPTAPGPLPEKPTAAEKAKYDRNVAAVTPVAGGPPDTNGGGKYRQMQFWSFEGAGTSCTSTCTTIAGMVAKGSKADLSLWAWGAPLSNLPKKNAKPDPNAPPWKGPSCWVPWGSDPLRPMPNVGDVYVLYRDVIKQPLPDKPSGTDVSHLRHCGFVLQVPKDETEKWITADGGQNDPTTKRQAAFLNAHAWKLAPAGTNANDQAKWKDMLNAHPFAKPIDGVNYPYLGGGAESAQAFNMADANRMIGWIDMNDPSIVLVSEALDADQANPQAMGKITQKDFDRLGAMIDLVAKLMGGP